MTALVLWATLPTVAYASSFGGAGLGIAMELDAQRPVEPLLDLWAVPVLSESGAWELAWASAELSWFFLRDGSGKVIDRGSVVAVTGQRQLEQGLVVVNVRVGQVLYDWDRSVVDLGLGDAGIGVRFFDGQLTAGLGLGLRNRFLLNAQTERYELALDLPVRVAYDSPDDRPWFVNADLAVVPGIGILGPDVLLFAHDLKVAGGYAIVQGTEIDLRAGLEWRFTSDTLTSRGPFLDNKLGVGVRVAF